MTSHANVAKPDWTEHRVDGWWHWWPSLVGPAAMGIIYLAHSLQWQALLDGRGKILQEQLALILLALSAGANAGRYCAQRQAWHLLLLVVTLVFFCRELHFNGTGVGIYVGLAVIGAWALRRRQRLLATLFRGQFRFWLISTAGTYVLALLIAQRAFKRIYLPYEAELHIELEEIVENAAHLLLFITALVGTRDK